jgi:hypothetical protein
MQGTLRTRTWLTQSFAPGRRSGALNCRLSALNLFRMVTLRLAQVSMLADKLIDRSDTPMLLLVLVLPIEYITLLPLLNLVRDMCRVWLYACPGSRSRTPGRQRGGTPRAPGIPSRKNSFEGHMGLLSRPDSLKWREDPATEEVPCCLTFMQTNPYSPFSDLLRSNHDPCQLQQQSRGWLCCAGASPQRNAG